MPVIARREKTLDGQRQQLEVDLLQSGWQLFSPGPKWLERDDKLFEKTGLLGARRILTDEDGVFTYKLQGQRFWKRHRGVVGYDRPTIMDAFERRGYDE